MANNDYERITGRLMAANAGLEPEQAQKAMANKDFVNLTATTVNSNQFREYGENLVGKLFSVMSNLVNRVNNNNPPLDSDRRATLQTAITTLMGEKSNLSSVMTTLDKEQVVLEEAKTEYKSQGFFKPETKDKLRQLDKDKERIIPVLTETALKTLATERDLVVPELGRQAPTPTAGPTETPTPSMG